MKCLIYLTHQHRFIKNFLFWGHLDKADGNLALPSTIQLPCLPHSIPIFQTCLAFCPDSIDSVHANVLYHFFVGKRIYFKFSRLSCAPVKSKYLPKKTAFPVLFAVCKRSIHSLKNVVCIICQFVCKIQHFNHSILIITLIMMILLYTDLVNANCKQVLKFSPKRLFS